MVNSVLSADQCEFLCRLRKINLYKKRLSSRFIVDSKILAIRFWFISG